MWLRYTNSVGYTNSYTYSAYMAYRSPKRPYFPGIKRLCYVVIRNCVLCRLSALLSIKQNPCIYLDRFSRFSMGPKCYAVQCIVNVEENPQNYHLPLGFHYRARGDRATAIGNMHEKFRKDRACSSGDSLADRQTDTETDRHTATLILSTVLIKKHVTDVITVLKHCGNMV